MKGMGVLIVVLLFAVPLEAQEAKRRSWLARNWKELALDVAVVTGRTLATESRIRCEHAYRNAPLPDRNQGYCTQLSDGLERFEGYGTAAALVGLNRIEWWATGKTGDKYFRWIVGSAETVLVGVDFYTFHGNNGTTNYLKNDWRSRKVPRYR